MIPSVRNPPGGSIIIIAGELIPSGTSKIVPLPRISRTAEIRESATVNPSPIPRPSTADLTTPFLDAKASALARIIQLTTISGMKRPSDAESDGMYALRIRSTTVTNVAIITT